MIKSIIILAGGMGTRLSDVSPLPKCLININGIPVIHHQLNSIQQTSITDVHLMLGYRHKEVKTYIESLNIPLNIHYHVEHTQLGTSGALTLLNPTIIDNDFMIIYGDLMFELDLNDIITYHVNNKHKYTIMINTNTHPYDSDSVSIDNNNIVLELTRTHNPRIDSYNNSGIYIFNKDIFKYISPHTDFTKDIIPALLKDEIIHAYHTTDYLMDIGTPTRLREVINDYNKSTT